MKPHQTRFVSNPSSKELIPMVSTQLQNSETFKNTYFSLKNATFQIELGCQFTGNSYLVAYFQLRSESDSMISTLTWSLNLTSGRLLGPMLSAYPITYGIPSENLTSYAPTGTDSSTVQYASSSNWGGYEFYDSYVGVPTIDPITAFSANVNVVSLTEPPSSEKVTSVYYNGVYYTIYRDGSPWIGLSQGSGGTGGLIQSGYDWNDAGSGLNIWYADYPSTAMIQYSGQATYPVHVGDILSLTLQQSGGYWDFEVYDYNNGHTYTASISSSEETYYAQTIVEAVTYQYPNGVQLTQQIPEFDTPVNFEGADIYGAGPGGYYESIDITSLYDNNWYNEYYLQQDSNQPDNINNAYIMQTGTYYTNIYGYPQETWENSYYNLYGGQNSPPSSGGGSGGGGCVLYGTLISASRDQMIPVQDLKVEQNLLSYNTNDGKLVQEKVSAINVTQVNSIFDINDGLLYVSGASDQPIYVTLPNGTQSWIMVGNLSTSDFIFDPLNTTWVHVQSIHVLDGNYTVYDIQGTRIFNENGYLRSNYIANGVLLDRKIP